MKIDSKFLKFVFTSPWPLLIFFVIPLIVALSVVLQLHLQLASSLYPLLLNNACLTLFAALRCIFYLIGLTRPIRYGSDTGTSLQFIDCVGTVGTVRSSMTDAGYVFNSSGDYGEKRDIGYLGSMILYAGLFLFLITGIWDNLYQYSGTLLDGIGASTDLNQVEVYRHLTTGPLTRKPETLPKMKILKQFIPDIAYPRGAAEIAFLSSDGQEKTVILKAPDIYRAGAYDIFMSKMVYEPTISITIDNTRTVFRGNIMLNQLAQKVDGFGFYGSFVEDNVSVNVYYQPEKSRLRVVLNHGEKKLLDNEFIFQVDRLSRLANVTVTCDKMGVWSDIHVVHRRHMNMIWIGGIVALIGLMMRIVIRPQRIWLEETQKGSRIRVVGKEAIKGRTENSEKIVR